MEVPIPIEKILMAKQKESSQHQVISLTTILVYLQQGDKSMKNLTRTFYWGPFQSKLCLKKG